MKREKNNKGFSLVELIIVIAIMVILVAVIVPQYLKYVNNSKISVDVQTAGELVTLIDTEIANGKKPFTGVVATDTMGVKLSEIGLTSAPKSKYDASYHFVVTGTDAVGVTKIQLWSDATGTNKYEVYPDPDNTTDGMNNTTVGLRK